ncbi:MAG: ankyrin repeat domain-containing protein, partial [Planctomycetia bacterium]|nr:ankyrin repeat domain-containing protein [Planctomycetia bacterium]
DVVEQDVTFDMGGGETVTETLRAPVVERKLIRQRLKEAVPRLESQFPGRGSLRSHAAKLREAVDAIHKAYPFVTIEYHDVAGVAGVARWEDIILRVLEFLSGKDIPDARERLLDAADLDDIRRFVPVSRYLNDDDVEKEEWIVLDALLGGDSPREVPWLTAAREQLPLPELLVAIGDGQADRVAELLQSGADPNSVDPNSQATALEAAISPWSWQSAFPPANLRIVELLMAAGARVTDVSLACAAKLVPLEVFQAMFTAHPNPNACDELGKPALHYACESAQRALARVGLLLDAGADVNRRTPTHYSALREAYDAKNLPLARLLFERGLDSCAADEVLVAANAENRRRGNRPNEWLEFLRSHKTRLVD